MYINSYNQYGFGSWLKGNAGTIGQVAGGVGGMLIGGPAGAAIGSQLLGGVGNTIQQGYEMDQQNSEQAALQAKQLAEMQRQQATQNALGQLNPQQQYGSVMANGGRIGRANQPNAAQAPASRPRIEPAYTTNPAQAPNVRSRVQQANQPGTLQSRRAFVQPAFVPSMGMQPSMYPHIQGAQQPVLPMPGRPMIQGADQPQMIPTSQPRQQYYQKANGGYTGKTPVAQAQQPNLATAQVPIPPRDGFQYAETANYKPITGRTYYLENKRLGNLPKDLLYNDFKKDPSSYIPATKDMYPSYKMKEGQFYKNFPQIQMEHQDVKQMNRKGRAVPKGQRIAPSNIENVIQPRANGGYISGAEQPSLATPQSPRSEFTIYGNNGELYSNQRDANFDQDPLNIASNLHNIRSNMGYTIGKGMSIKPGSAIEKDLRSTYKYPYTRYTTITNPETGETFNYPELSGAEYNKLIKERGYNNARTIDTQKKANGGYLEETRGNNDITYYANGGTHEQNPYGGVPVGNNSSVEQGEIRHGDYIFSNRIPYKTK